MKEVLICVFIIVFFILLVKWNGWLRGLYQISMGLLISILAAQKEVFGHKGEFVALAVAVFALTLHFIWSSTGERRMKPNEREK